MSDPNTWMIYGANGYTGALCAEYAADAGHAPILAGRNRDKVEALGKRLGLETRVFGLDDQLALDEALQDVTTVLHCAGPFSQTAAPMMESCLRTGTHYLDITGERTVFESLFDRNHRALEAGITMVSGVGLDVVPTDCLALMLHEELPEARDLELAIFGLGSPSGGTLKTVIENLGTGGWIRVEGELKRVPTGWRSRQVTFPHKRRTIVTAPLGDVVSAYHSTGIPNIRTYYALPPKTARVLRVIDPLSPLLRARAFVRLAQSVVGKVVDGPDEKTREEAFVDIWGEVRDADGNSVKGTLTLPEGYKFTYLAAVACALHVAAGDAPHGALAPATAFGPRFVLDIPGVTFHGFRRKGREAGA